MTTRAKALPIILTALLVLGGTVGTALANHAVNIAQKQTPNQLKNSCDKVNGQSGVTQNGTAYCFNNAKGTSVYCDTKTHVCTGVVPD